MVGSSWALGDWLPDIPKWKFPWLDAIGTTCEETRGDPECGLGIFRQRFIMCNVHKQIEICTHDPPENAKAGFSCGACANATNYFWKYDP